MKTAVLFAALFVFAQAKSGKTPKLSQGVSGSVELEDSQH